MFTEKELLAYAFAREVHKTQFRKGGTVPYIKHLESVASLLKIVDASEEQVVAGLLHGAIEDQGVADEVIQTKFGAEVLRLVKACSEENGGLPWKSRKEMTIKKLLMLDDASFLVALADKLSNLEDSLLDYKLLGEEFWARFNAGKAEQLWYYESLGKIFLERAAQKPLTERYAKAFGEFKAIAQGN